MLQEKIFEKLGLKGSREAKKGLQFVTVPKKPKPNEKDRIITMDLNTFQADLVQLPDDEGYNYIFVIVNIATNNMDCEPQMTKTMLETSESLKTIYKRKVITNQIRFLQTDQGSEFKNELFTKFCSENDIELHFASTRRKNQMAKVEWMIGLLTKFLYKQMSVNSYADGNWNKKWVKYVVPVKDEINKYYAEKFDRKEQMLKYFQYQPYMNEIDNLIPIGTKVYPMLFKPVDVFDDGRRLFGNFRHGDFRFDLNNPCKIKEWIIRAGRPIRYLLETLDGTTVYDTTFTRRELLIDPKEQAHTIEEQNVLDENNELIRQGKANKVKKPAHLFNRDY